MMQSRMKNIGFFCKLKHNLLEVFYSINLSKYETHAVYELTQTNAVVEGFGPQVISIPFNHTQEARIVASDAIISQQMFIRKIQ